MIERVVGRQACFFSQNLHLKLSKSYQSVANSWCIQCNEQPHSSDRHGMVRGSFVASIDWDVQLPCFRDLSFRFSCDKWSHDVSPCRDASTTDDLPSWPCRFSSLKFDRNSVVLVSIAAREPSQCLRDEPVRRMVSHTSRFVIDSGLVRQNLRRKLCGQSHMRRQKGNRQQLPISNASTLDRLGRMVCNCHRCLYFQFLQIYLHTN